MDKRNRIYQGVFRRVLPVLLTAAVITGCGRQEEPEVTDLYPRLGRDGQHTFHHAGDLPCL